MTGRIFSFLCWLLILPLRLVCYAICWAAVLTAVMVLVPFGIFIVGVGEMYGTGYGVLAAVGVPVVVFLAWALAGVLEDASETLWEGIV